MASDQPETDPRIESGEQPLTRSERMKLYWSSPAGEVRRQSVIEANKRRRKHLPKGRKREVEAEPEPEPVSWKGTWEPGPGRELTPAEQIALAAAWARRGGGGIR